MTTNTTSNCNLTSFQLYNSVYLLELTLYILIFFFGAIFNALALWVFFCKVKKWTETRVYIVNLVFADCSVICSLPLVIYLRWNKSGRDELCQAAEAVYFINMEVSIYITLFISLDRYVAIRHPLAARALRSPGKAALLCALPWLAATAAAALRLKGRQATGCFQRDAARPPPLSLLSLFFVFTLPLTTLTFCSIQVIRNLRRRLNTNSPEVNLTRKAIYIIYTNMAVFLVCFLPAYLGVLTTLLMESTGASCSSMQVMRNFSSVTRCIATSNCCLDSICYYFVTQEFQEALCLSKETGGKASPNHVAHKQAP